MSSLRIVAATGVAALTLGGGFAAAQTTAVQTATITVGEAPMSVSVDGAPEFSVALGATGVNLTHQTSTLSFENPSTQVGEANVTIARNSAALEALVLGVSIADATGYTPSAAPSWTAVATTETTLVTAIATGTDVSGVTLTWTLTGTAPAAAAVITTDFTYTIAQ